MARKKTPTDVLDLFANEWSAEDKDWFLDRLIGKVDKGQQVALLVKLSRDVENGLSVAFLHGEPLSRYLFVKSLNCGCEHYYEWLLRIEEQQHLQEQDKARKERIAKWKERQNHKLKTRLRKTEELLEAYKSALKKCEEQQGSVDILEFVRPLVADKTWPEIAKAVLAKEGKPNPSEDEVRRKAKALRVRFHRNKQNDQE